MPEPDPSLPPQEPISDREPPVLIPAMRVSARTMRWRYLGVGTGFVILCALVFFVARHEPVSQKQYYPQCGFKKATGLDCPGCGGLRSVHITHCIKLLSNTEALGVLPPNVTVVKEKKKKDKAVD